MRGVRNALYGAGLVTLALGLAGVAQAQTAPQQSPAGTTEAAPQEPGAGEIVVTANKREENLNKVGLTIEQLMKLEAK